MDVKRYTRKEMSLLKILHHKENFIYARSGTLNLCHSERNFEFWNEILLFDNVKYFNITLKQKPSNS